MQVPIPFAHYMNRGQDVFLTGPITQGVPASYLCCIGNSLMQGLSPRNFWAALCEVMKNTVRRKRKELGSVLCFR